MLYGGGQAEDEYKVVSEIDGSEEWLHWVHPNKQHAREETADDAGIPEHDSEILEKLDGECGVGETEEAEAGAGGQVEAAGGVRRLLSQ